MSYVIEYAQSVHSTFRAPNNFCHDLQHVMRGAIKNLSQTCLLTDEPQLLARYQVIFSALQTIIETNTTMSECTVEQSETLTMMDSAADYLAASATTDSLVGTHRRAQLSASSFKSSELSKEANFTSFDQVGAENLSAVLSSDMVAQLGEVYNTAVLLSTKEGELKVLAPKVKKYAKHKKSEKLLAAQQEEMALNREIARLKGLIQEGLTAAFPEIYKCILRQYIDLCNSLLHATQVGAEILQHGAAAMSAGGNGESHLPAVGSAAGSRQVSLALTVDALEAHEALEEVKHELTHRGASKTAAQVLHDRIDSLLSSPPQPASEVAAADKNTITATEASPAAATTTMDSPDHQQESEQASPTLFLAPPAALETSPTEPSAAHQSAGASTHSSVTVPAPAVPADASTQCGNSGPTPPHPHPLNAAEENDHHLHNVIASDDDDDDASEHAEESVSPSLAGAVHARFPFWFRYFYFDRLANSTERLAIAFTLYVSYCKRLARKSGYTIPPPIRRHMDRMEMECTTARYARHKRDFQVVLKEIFNYRKNLEVMETYVRMARDAEAHVQKHTKAKNKKGLAKWSAKLEKTNNAIEQLRVELFGRGAEEMIQFYDQLLQCIRSSLSDLIITLGGSPE